jgi:hypothetical protein
LLALEATQAGHPCLKLSAATEADAGALPADWAALYQKNELKSFMAVPVCAGSSILGLVTVAAEDLEVIDERWGAAHARYVLPAAISSSSTGRLNTRASLFYLSAAWCRQKHEHGVGRGMSKELLLNAIICRWILVNFAACHFAIDEGAMLCT